MRNIDLPDRNKFILTTIADNCVAILETHASEQCQKGEYILSDGCVQQNVATGKFTEVEATGHKGRLYVLTEDLNR